MDKVPEGDATIIMGYSAYSCNNFMHNLSKCENVAVITRIIGNKAMYKKYENKKKALREKKKIWQKIFT